MSVEVSGIVTNGRTSDRSQFVGETAINCNRLVSCVRIHTVIGGTRWRTRLRHCATSQKVAVSIPDGVIGIYH